MTNIEPQEEPTSSEPVIDFTEILAAERDLNDAGAVIDLGGNRFRVLGKAPASVIAKFIALGKDDDVEGFIDGVVELFVVEDRERLRAFLVAENFSVKGYVSLQKKALEVISGKAGQQLSS